VKASCLCITVFFLKLLIAPLWLVQFCNCYVILYQGCILFIRIYLFFNVFWNCKCYPVVGASWCMFLTFPLGSDVSGPTAWKVSGGIGVRAHGSPTVQFPPVRIMTPWAHRNGSILYLIAGIS